MNTIIINCPNIPVIIEEINCGVFRHGVIKKNRSPNRPSFN